MFETIQHAPFVTLGLLAVGAALGLVAGIFVLPAARRARRLETEIGALRADHDRYQRRVTEHFQTTAVLVGDLTSSYKAVYEHLASGARTLSDPALAAHGFGAPQLIVHGAGQQNREQDRAQDRALDLEQEHRVQELAQDRLPQDPIAHDTDPVSESVPAEPPVADEPAAETGESASPPDGPTDGPTEREAPGRISGERPASAPQS